MLGNPSDTIRYATTNYFQERISRFPPKLSSLKFIRNSINFTAIQL